jgi:hypothetical protein
MANQRIIGHGDSSISPPGLFLYDHWYSKEDIWKFWNKTLEDIYYVTALKK